LEINPRLPEALLLKADLAWANFQPELAAEILQEQVLRLNPVWEEALGRLAASYFLKDKEAERNASSAFSRLVAEVTARNPHAGEFFVALASWLDDRHRLAEAERLFGEAARRMPQLVGPQWHLALVALRTGDEPKAKKLLEEAFRVDPFNLRVKNSLEVLDVLDGYETLENAEVAIRFDPKRDKLLARYAARYLETAYPELCRQLGYRPPRKPLVEIFNEGRGARGSQWLATRMIGLPYVGPIAASTGHIVAMTSPNDAGRPGAFSWARVLRHELVHVITLQQTHFNMPHWYTEGLAVRAEGPGRPERWNALLVKRVAEGKLFDLETINFIFTRPHTGEDSQMAYCQSALYVDYMVALGGEEAVGKLLGAYAENRATAEAIREVFGVSQEEFERGYREYLRKVVARFPGLRAAPQEDIAELLKARRARPADMRVAAELAYGYLQRGADKEARALAEEVRKVHPAQPLASYVLARLLAREGKTQEAIALLEQCLRLEQPDLKVVNLLAGLKLKAGNHVEAAELYSLGAKLEPYNLGWVRSLARVYLAAKDEARLPDALARLARADPDDLATRKKLIEMSLGRKDYRAAEDWANQALQIDVQDAEVHGTFAEALAASHNFARAIEELQTAIELDPNCPGAEALLEKLHRAEKKDKK
jgi:Flp pilus assembly protein TadD